MAVQFSLLTGVRHGMLQWETAREEERPQVQDYLHKLSDSKHQFRKRVSPQADLPNDRELPVLAGLLKQAATHSTRQGLGLHWVGISDAEAKLPHTSI